MRFFYLCWALSLHLSLPVEATQVLFEGVNQSDIKSLRMTHPKVFTKGVRLPEMDDIIRLLILTERYGRAEIRSKNGSLLIKAVPIRIIRNVNISGNKFFSSDKILDIIRFAPEKRLVRKDVTESASQLKKLYLEAGYFETKIKVELRKRESNQTDIFLKIEEGEPCRVKEIKIVTANSKLNKKLKKETAGFVGKNYIKGIQDQIRQSLTRYLQENRYLNSSVTDPSLKLNDKKTEAVLELSIERPYKFVLLFEGNKLITSKDLVKKLDLKASTLGINAAGELAERIQKIYGKRGYATNKVTFTEKIFTKSFTRQVNLKIAEGFKIKIKSFAFSGVLTRDQNYYEDFVKEHSSDLIASGHYSASDIKTGLDNLITHLKNQGHVKARILSSRVEYTKDMRRVTILVNMDEGPITRIKKIEFDGLKNFSKLKLIEILQLKGGEPLRLKTLENGLGRILEFYRSKGYLDFRILNKDAQLVQYNRDNTLATIHFELREGPQVIVKSIILEGNDLTKDYVILKETEFNIGDVLTIEKIRDSEFRLQKMGLFSNVEIRTLEAGTTVAERTIVITVRERNPGLFNFGANISYETQLARGFSYKGFIGLTYRNLGGTARSVTGRGEANIIQLGRIEKLNSPQTNFFFPEHIVNLGYMEPFFFGERLRGRFNLTRNVRFDKEEPAEADKKNILQAQETNQFSVALERDLTKNLKLIWSVWRFANTRTYAIYGDLTEQKLNIASTGPTLEWDRRDNPFNPQRGVFFRLNMEYSDPALGSNDTVPQIVTDPKKRDPNDITVKFLRINTVFNFYISLGSRKLTLANSIRGGTSD